MIKDAKLISKLMVMMITTTSFMMVRADSSHNYGDALTKSILFFEGQRSGKLPPSQRMTWRKDSALNDGSDAHLDMVGGYYDAGDNVKFHFPMAFSTTMLAWGVLEFGNSMESDLQNALEAIRWGSDYFVKATRIRNLVVAQIGEPYGDHDCWERPEDMDTPRNTYVLTPNKPGSELSAEIAAALAASSMAFGASDPQYSKLLLSHAIRAFDFANNNRGSYNDSVGSAACPFYCDFSGYMDELLWGAAWLYKATKKRKYWNFVKENIGSIESANVIRNIKGVSVLMSGGGFTEFGWDCKNAGINVLVSEWVMTDPSHASPFIPNADNFVCSVLPNSPTKSVFYSKGGLMFKPGSSNLQHVTSISFLLIVYARHMQAAKKVVNCGGVTADPNTLINLAKSQVDYILGSNPLGMSYMVGYGNKFPQKIHHRGSTLPSLDQHPQQIKCRDGDQYFQTNAPNPNVLVGAVIGGPAEDDAFEDSRYNVGQSEPTTYLNAPFVGLVAYFKSPQASSGFVKFDWL
ncbi:endoglucanase 8-like [Prosopis cineraria]|uniref:endoglucanase 8-like n=1 Tax=Prosopis cineraria TaxID=364024 RepID=UPI00240FFEB4|nr:endoglucanase 8-like [Prosopis cineraria]